MSVKACNAVIVTFFAGMFGLSASSATAGPENDVPDAGNPGFTCPDRAALSTRMDLADLSRARQILGHPDEWARQLSSFDMGVRQKTTQPTSLQQFLAFTAASGLDWTLGEEAAWKPLVDKLSQALVGLNLHLPNIDLVKTIGVEEFGSAYTRVHAIMVPKSAASLPMTDARRAYFLLAHELFHILSRADSHLRDELYALLGFRRVKGFQYPTELEDRRVSNPDSFEYLHTLTVQAGPGSVDVLPVIQSLRPLNEVIQLPNFFTALDIVLLSIDTSTGDVRRDANGNLIKYNFGNTNWVPLMLRNSSYIIQPEELLADNFATLMEWRSNGVLPPSNPGGVPVNDINLLVAIQGVLANGCRN